MAGGSSGAQAGNAVVEGIVLISHSLASVLFDMGATRSLISKSFLKTLGLKPETLEVLMYLNSPLGCVEVSNMCK